MPKISPSDPEHPSRAQTADLADRFIDHVEAWLTRDDRIIPMVMLDWPEDHPQLALRRDDQRRREHIKAGFLHDGRLLAVSLSRLGLDASGLLRLLNAATGDDAGRAGDVWPEVKVSLQLAIIQLRNAQAGETDLIDRLVSSPMPPRLSDDELAQMRVYLQTPLKLPALQADPAERERRQRLKEIVAYNDELRVKEVRGDSLTTDAKLVTEGHEALSVGQFSDRAIGLLERAEVLRLDAQRKDREAAEQGRSTELRADPSSVLGSAEELNRLKYQFDAMARPLVQVAYALNIDAAALDDFVRTGNPDLVTEAIRVLRQIQGEDLRRKQPAAPTATDWRDVKRRLLELYDQGDPYTTIADLANRVGCGTTTIHKAIKDSSKLKGWQARHTKGKKSQGASSLNDVVLNNTRQTDEPDPSDVLTDDDMDIAMRRLIEEAGPEEKTRLNGLSEDERRALVRVFYEHNLDIEPSPLDQSDRRRLVRQFKRL